MVLGAFVYSPFNHLMVLLAGDSFIELYGVRSVFAILPVLWFVYYFVLHEVIFGHYFHR